MNLIDADNAPHKEAFAELFVAVGVSDIVVVVEEEAEQNGLFFAGKTVVVFESVVDVVVTRVVLYCVSCAKWTLKEADN